MPPCGCGSGDSPLTEDAVGKCGGTCVEDVDEDGICDADDPCVSQIGGVKCDPENNVDCPRLNQCDICTTPANSEQFTFYREKVQYQDASNVPCTPNWRKDGQPCIPGSQDCKNLNEGCNQVVTYEDVNGAPCPGANVSGCYAVYTVCEDPTAAGCHWGTTGCRTKVYLDPDSNPCHPDSTNCTAVIQDNCFDTTTACDPGTEGCQTSEGICNCTTQMLPDGTGETVATTVSKKFTLNVWYAEQMTRIPGLGVITSVWIPMVTEFVTTMKFQAAQTPPIALIMRHSPK